MTISTKSIKLGIEFFIFYFLLSCYIGRVKGTIEGDLYYSEDGVYTLKLPWRGWVSQYVTTDNYYEDLRLVNSNVEGEIVIMSFRLKEVYKDKDINLEAIAMEHLQYLESEGILKKFTNFEETKVAGFPGKKINFSGPLKKGILIIFNRNIEIYVFRFIISPMYFDEQQPVFDEVVKSFTFFK